MTKTSPLLPKKNASSSPVANTTAVAASSLITSYNGVENNPDKKEEDVTDATSMGVKPYSRNVAIAMTLNYIIGTGCFGLPFAFQQSGLVLTSLFLIIGGLLAFISMNYTLEIMARAEGVSAAKSDLERPSVNHVLTYRKFDFTTIAHIFMGSRGKFLVQSVMTLYCIGALWSYASVFASSVASLAFKYIFVSSPACDIYSNDGSSAGCEASYYVAMAIYTVLVVTLVLMNIGDQAMIQSCLTYYRIIALSIMLVTMTIKLFSESSEEITDRISRIGSFNFQNFSKGFGPTMLAITCHYNMPDALQPLSDKSTAKFVAFISLGVSCVFYLVLGIVGAFAFEDVNALITLNWVDFTGCGSGWSTCNNSSVLEVIGHVVRMVILLFPVVTVTSAYPMVGITMGENLYAALPNQAVFGNSTRRLCRLAAALPPLVLATAFKKLDVIFTIAGMFGFVLVLTIPCLLQYVSWKVCDEKYQKPLTMFSVPGLSGPTSSIGFLIISVAVTIVAIVTL